MSIAESVQTTSKAPSSSSSGLVLQRKCACGGSVGFSGECEECKRNKLLGKPLQRKLAINEPGDEYEREADRVAEQVMQMPEPERGPGVAESPRTPLVQRRVNGGGPTGIGTAPQIVHDVLNTPGQPLDASTRAFFEPRFGHDFSSVRIHADAKSAQSARAVNAQAYTVGNHIAFGRYTPGTTGSNALLAHELTHVMQQANFKEVTPTQVQYVQRQIPATEVSHGITPEGVPEMSKSSLEELDRIQVAGIDVLVATDAFQGIQRSLGWWTPPDGTGVNVSDHLYLQLADNSRYLINAETRSYNTENRQVVFFTAYHESRGEIEWIIGPDSLQLFIDTVDDFAADADLPDIETGEGQPSVLRSAPITFQGVQFHYLVEQVPYTQGTPFDFIIHTGPFLLAPNVIYDEYRNPYVVYYLAYHRGSDIPAYFVGPDSVGDFIANVNTFDVYGGLVYFSGYPSAHQIESARALDALIQGDIFDAAKHWSQSWRAAFADPGWWQEMGLAIVGGRGGATGTKRSPKPQLRVVRKPGSPLGTSTRPTVPRVVPLAPAGPATLPPGPAARAATGGGSQIQAARVIEEPLSVVKTPPQVKPQLELVIDNPNPVRATNLNPGSPIVAGAGIIVVAGTRERATENLSGKESTSPQVESSEMSTNDEDDDRKRKDPCAEGGGYQSPQESYWYSLAVGNGAFTFSINKYDETRKVVIRDAGATGWQTKESQEPEFQYDAKRAVSFLKSKLRDKSTPTEFVGEKEKYIVCEVSISHLHGDHFNLLPELLEDEQLQIRKIVVNKWQWDYEREKRNFFRDHPLPMCNDSQPGLTCVKILEQEMLASGSDDPNRPSWPKAFMVKELPTKKKGNATDTASTVYIDKYRDFMVVSAFDPREEDFLNLPERFHETVSSSENPKFNVLVEGHHWMKGGADDQYFMSNTAFKRYVGYLKKLAQYIEDEETFIATSSVAQNKDESPCGNLRKMYLLHALGFDVQPMYATLYLEVGGSDSGVEHRVKQYVDPEEQNTTPSKRVAGSLEEEKVEAFSMPGKKGVLRQAFNQLSQSPQLGSIVAVYIARVGALPRAAALPDFNGVDLTQARTNLQNDKACVEDGMKKSFDKDAPGDITWLEDNLTREAAIEEEKFNQIKERITNGKGSNKVTLKLYPIE